MTMMTFLIFIIPLNVSTGGETQLTRTRSNQYEGKRERSTHCNWYRLGFSFSNRHNSSISACMSASGPEVERPLMNTNSPCNGSRLGEPESPPFHVSSVRPGKPALTWPLCSV